MSVSRIFTGLVLVGVLCVLWPAGALAQTLGSLSCIGFGSPMDHGPVTVRKPLVLPLKAQLVDASGNSVTDADLPAPPVLQVTYQSAEQVSAVDVTEEAISPIWTTTGNQFIYFGERWRFNFQTHPYTAPGTYSIGMVSGSPNDYLISPSCAAYFVIGP